MKVAIFDAFNGAGGDMILSTLIDSVITESELHETVELFSLKLDFRVESVNVKGIEAKRVVVNSRKTERSYSDIVSMINSSNLDEDIKADCLAIFELLAKAEAKVHGNNYRDAVFHEVGADDAVFDVVCCVRGIRKLMDMGYRFFAKPVRLGSGFVEFSHGKYPVPAPAVLEILKDARIKAIFEGEGELLTPTAAAILSYYCKDFPPLPVKVENVFYGAGSRDTEVPNVLRLILGRVEVHDSVAVIETAVDDISGEFIGYAVEKLTGFDGVLDAAVIPAYGKKMRPVSVLKVIAEADKAEEVATELMKLTGSLGVRIIPVHHRIIAERGQEVVKVKIADREFEVRIKRSSPGFAHAKPEFDDIVRVADELNMPIHVVYRKIMRVLDDADTFRK